MPGTVFGYLVPYLGTVFALVPYLPHFVELVPLLNLATDLPEVTGAWYQRGRSTRAGAYQRGRALAGAEWGIRIVDQVS